MRILVFASLALASLFLAGAGDAATHQVQIVDFAFDPPNLTVALGDSIVWTNAGAMPHTSTSGDECVADGDWDSGTLNPGDSFTYVADEVGEFHYFCAFHCPTMEGELGVEDNGTATDAATWGSVRAIYR